METANKVQNKLKEFYDSVASILIEYLETTKILHRVIKFREIEYDERRNELNFCQGTASVIVRLGDRRFDVKEVIERVQKNWPHMVQVVEVQSLEYTESCIRKFCGDNVKKDTDEKYITFYGDQGAFKIEISRALNIFNKEVMKNL
jgi:hypothetical protein